jgi:hypothetical protein
MNASTEGAKFLIVFALSRVHDYLWLFGEALCIWGVL